MNPDLINQAYTQTAELAKYLESYRTQRRIPIGIFAEMVSACGQEMRLVASTALWEEESQPTEEGKNNVVVQ